METSINTTGYTSLIAEQFTVKSEKKAIVFGDRAITYNRCSTEKQDSIEWQAKITSGLVKRKGWTLVKSFGAKESAKTDDRKVFLEMREFCRQNNISHIVFYSYDRFSRAGNLALIDELRAEGIRVHSATQELDDETPGGRMMQKVFLVFAEADNRFRSQKVIEGQRNKLRKGEWNVKPPLGYDKRFRPGHQDGDLDKPQCYINEKGLILRQAFYWKDRENLSNTEIMYRLKTMGLSLKLPQLTRIFQNPFYCGYITSSLLDEKELIRGKHEPLIDEATFLRVNGLTKELPHGWKIVRHDAEMPLKASVRCATCDKPLTGYVQKEYVYYKCPSTGCCVNLNSKKLHKLFVDKLSKFSILPELKFFVKTQLEETYWALHKSEIARVKPMKDEIARLKQELLLMEKTLSTGKVPYEIYERQSGINEEKIRGIEVELEKLGQDTSNLVVYLDKILQNLENLPGMWEKLDLVGKVRLQKLVYPAGLQYVSENHTLRTLVTNPIFSAITSISQNLSVNNAKEKYAEDEKLSQLYLGFTSSNFLSEKLKEIAVTLNVLLEQVNLASKMVVTLSGSTPIFYSCSTTMRRTESMRFSKFSVSENSISGSTGQHLYR